ncbi:glycine zipper family protein [Simiduia agarivorans]|uniref:Glycine zipper family protein n=1 Tax=Simiduia agarivorans (strain DSM 21679 / JCM 13881 / BCRC 17597 / SA1) TaxID=1117647 RepID=K4KJ49_SIMAS|nr:glycine zipper family protein [Simiduia agarivorans]AFU98205.1 hypothetical protein M5M_04990 [Simiduia agarivorans SA1 = DSM 21679]
MKHLLVFIFALTLTACARNKPIVDTKGIDPVAYEQDLAECQQYAAQVDTGGKAAGGAVAGAVVGGAMGAVINGSKGARTGAGVGAIGSTAKGAARGAREQQQVVKNCLRGRGYKVLN